MSSMVGRVETKAPPVPRQGRRQGMPGLRWMAHLWLAAWVAVTASCVGCQTKDAPAAARGPLSLLLVTLDTTRRDFTSPYGAPAGYTPALSRLAKRGAVLEGFSQLDVTNPSHISIMTGLPALKHGVFNNVVPLAPDVDTLPMAFHRAGYATGGFVSISHLGRTVGWQG